MNVYLLLAAVPLAYSQTLVCPTDFELESTNEECFHVSSTKMNKTACDSYCAMKDTNAHVACVPDAATDDFILTLRQLVSPLGGATWLSLVDDTTAVPNDFMWPSFCPASIAGLEWNATGVYENFDGTPVAEPNPPDNEKCVGQRKDGLGWDDLGCSRTPFCGCQAPPMDANTTTGNGDPHLRTSTGKMLDFYIAPNEWENIMSTPDFDLYGHAFENPDSSLEWFDGFSFRKKNDEYVIFDVNLVHGDKFGMVNDAEEENPSAEKLNFFEATIDGQKIVYAGGKYESKDGFVSVEPMKGSISIDGHSEDKFLVSTKHFKMEIIMKKARTHQLRGQSEKKKYTHIDFAFSSMIPHSVEGPLANIIYKK